jgi:hypothetical protein
VILYALETLKMHKPCGVSRINGNRSNLAFTGLSGSEGILGLKSGETDSHKERCCLFFLTPITHRNVEK